MVGFDVISLSRFNKWLPFFEEESEKRDTANWWSQLEWLKETSIDIVMTVSDRASALLKVATVDYLDTFSMPDLFHFMQDLGRTVGGQLGLQAKRVRKKLSKTNCETVGYDSLMLELKEKEDRLQEYKTVSYTHLTLPTICSV